MNLIVPFIQTLKNGTKWHVIWASLKRSELHISKVVSQQVRTLKIQQTHEIVTA